MTAKRSETWLRVLLGASLFFLGLAFGWAAALRAPSPGLQPAWLLLAAASVCTLALGAVLGGLRGWRAGSGKPDWGRPVALPEVWKAARIHGRQNPLWSLPRTETRAYTVSASETLQIGENREVIIEVWEGAPLDVYIEIADRDDGRIARLDAKQTLRIRFPQAGMLQLRTTATGLLDRDTWVLVHEITC